MKRLTTLSILTVAILCACTVVDAAYIRQFPVTVTTDGSGNATVYTTAAINGYIESVRYVKTDFADGVDVDITTEDTGVVVLDKDSVNASVTYSPRHTVQDTTGADVTYDGTRVVHERIAVAGERIKIVIASGGDKKTGTFYITVD